MVRIASPALSEASTSSTSTSSSSSRDGVLGPCAVGRRIAFVVKEDDAPSQHQRGIIVAYFPKTHKHRIRFDVPQGTGAQQQPQQRNVLLEDPRVNFYWLPRSRNHHKTSCTPSSSPTKTPPPQTTPCTASSSNSRYELAIQRDAVGRRLEVYHGVRQKWYSATILRFVSEVKQHTLQLHHNGKTQLVDLSISTWRYVDLKHDQIWTIRKDEQTPTTSTKKPQSLQQKPWQRDPTLLETSKYLGVTRIAERAWKVHYRKSSAQEVNDDDDDVEYLGCFSSEKDAALAFDLYARRYDGPVNFEGRRTPLKKRPITPTPPTRRRTRSEHVLEPDTAQQVEELSESHHDHDHDEEVVLQGVTADERHSPQIDDRRPQESISIPTTRASKNHNQLLETEETSLSTLSLDSASFHDRRTTTPTTRDCGAAAAAAAAANVSTSTSTAKRSDDNDDDGDATPQKENGKASKVAEEREEEAKETPAVEEEVETATVPLKKRKAVIQSSPSVISPPNDKKKSAQRRKKDGVLVEPSVAAQEEEAETVACKRTSVVSSDQDHHADQDSSNNTNAENDAKSNEDEGDDDAVNIMQPTESPKAAAKKGKNRSKTATKTTRVDGIQDVVATQKGAGAIHDNNHEKDRGSGDDDVALEENAPATTAKGRATKSAQDDSSIGDADEKSESNNVKPSAATETNDENGEYARKLGKAKGQDNHDEDEDSEKSLCGFDFWEEETDAEDGEDESDDEEEQEEQEGADDDGSEAEFEEEEKDDGHDGDDESIGVVSAHSIVANKGKKRTRDKPVHQVSSEKEDYRRRSVGSIRNRKMAAKKSLETNGKRGRLERTCFIDDEEDSTSTTAEDDLLFSSDESEGGQPNSLSHRRSRAEKKLGRRSKRMDPVDPDTVKITPKAKSKSESTKKMSSSKNAKAKRSKETSASAITNNTSKMPKYPVGTRFIKVSFLMCAGFVFHLQNLYMSRSSSNIILCVVVRSSGIPGLRYFRRKDYAF